MTQELTKQNPKLAWSAAFEKSRAKANREYETQLIKIIQDTASLGSASVQLVFLDKNHPPNGLNTVRSLLDLHIPRQDLVVHKLYLIPEQQASCTLLFDYPFSLEFISQILTYGLNRKEHGTLDNQNLPKLFGVILMFLRMNKGIKFNAAFLKKYGLDGFVQAKLTDDRNKVDKELEEAIIGCLRETPSKGLINEKSKMLQTLIEAVKQKQKEPSPPFE
jgi:hypothetical protein